MFYGLNAAYHKLYCIDASFLTKEEGMLFLLNKSQFNLCYYLHLQQYCCELNNCLEAVTIISLLFSQRYVRYHLLCFLFCFYLVGKILLELRFQLGLIWSVTKLLWSLDQFALRPASVICGILSLGLLFVSEIWISFFWNRCCLKWEIGISIPSSKPTSISWAGRKCYSGSELQWIDFGNPADKVFCVPQNRSLTIHALSYWYFCVL